MSIILATFTPKEGTTSISQNFDPIEKCLVCLASSSKNVGDPLYASPDNPDDALYGNLKSDCCKQDFHFSCLERVKKTCQGLFSCPVCRAPLDGSIFNKINLEDHELSCKINTYIFSNQLNELKNIFEINPNLKSLDHEKAKLFPSVISCFNTAVLTENKAAMVILKNRKCLPMYNQEKNIIHPISEIIKQKASKGEFLSFAIKTLIEGGCNPNESHEDYPLNAAYFFLSQHAIQTLEEYNVSYTFNDKRGINPLIAYFQGKYYRATQDSPTSELTPEEELHLVKKLISKGVNISSTREDKRGSITQIQTVLNDAAAAAYLPTLKFLIDKIPDSNTYFQFSEEENNEIDSYLRARRLNFSKEIKIKALPTSEALISKGIENLKYLLSTFPTASESFRLIEGEGTRPLILPLLIDAVRCAIKTEPPSYKKEANFLEKIKLLLDTEISPDILDSDCNSALHYLASKICQGDIINDNIFHLFCERGARVDVKNIAQERPLHLYATAPHTMRSKKIVNILGKDGGFSAQNFFGNTPLQIAIASYNLAASSIDNEEKIFYRKMIQDLCDKDPSIFKSKNSLGLTPLMVSASHRDDILRKVCTEDLLNEMDFTPGGRKAFNSESTGPDPWFAALYNTEKK